MTGTLIVVGLLLALPTVLTSAQSERLSKVRHGSKAPRGWAIAEMEIWLSKHREPKQRVLRRFLFEHQQSAS